MEVTYSKCSQLDKTFMQEALTLAEKGLWSTHPNPRVGCVIVNQGEVVGRGFHAKAGQAHAEIIALNDAGALAKNATCYITLEPCRHYGKTPPCTSALIAAGISRVVIACQDPNPLMQGKSITALRESGISVDINCLSAEAKKINAGFFKRMQENKPYVRLKMAMSLDGKTTDALGESKWITSIESREDVHQFRAQSDVILSSAKTVMKDNAKLTARPTPNKQRTIYSQPKRVILDSQLKLSSPSFFAEPGEILLCHAMSVKPKFLENEAVNYLALSQDCNGLNLKELMCYLGDTDHNEVWVEAGPTLAGSLLEQQLVDELILYIAPILLGHKAQDLIYFSTVKHLKDCYRLKVHDVEMKGGDVKFTLGYEESV